MVFRENSLGNIIPALNLEGDYNNVWTTLKYFCKIWYPQIYIQNIKQMEICTLDFCGGSDGKESAYSQVTWVWSLGWKIPWRRKWQPFPVFLPGEFHGQRSLVGYSPWGCKESDRTQWLTPVWSGLPRWLSGEEFACQCRKHGRLRFNPWTGKSPGEANGNPLQLGKPHGQRNLAGVLKSWTHIPLFDCIPCSNLHVACVEWTDVDLNYSFDLGLQFLILTITVSRTWQII